MENKLKHLEFIQGIINRMANNSFLLKGWTVVLVSALFALAAKGSNRCFIFLAFFPTIGFWVLDGYFLWQEKLYRELYNNVRIRDEQNIDFSMDISSVESEVASWCKVAISTTLRIFYGVIIGAIVIVILLAK